jgi:hypothetical protein
MMKIGSILRALGFVAASGAAACGGGSTPVTPPIVNNSPPTIESVTIAAARAEADHDIQVSAVVKDAETAVTDLTFAWAALPQNGTFTGSGATTMWRPPKGQTTPNLYTITLTVTERYSSAGQARQNIVTSSATVHYNDSPAETIFIAHDFLVNKFANYNVTPVQAVSNFSDSCPGKADELDDIENNRDTVHIESGSFPSPVATFNTAMTEGTVEGPCSFVDVPDSGPNAGRRERVSGVCSLATIYENFRWYLCESHFYPPFDTVPLSLRGRVPGRIMAPR